MNASRLNDDGSLAGCPCCGLVQRLPEHPAASRLCCVRCHSNLPVGRRSQTNSPAAAYAVAALILYPLAMTLPVMRIEQFGHQNETSILAGTAALLGNGYVFIGLIVLTCSILLPLAKLGALLVMTSAPWALAHHHRAITYRAVEWTGRWGMLDVLVVAVLVALLKLGDIVEVTPGPGAIAFATVVLLSLVAAASFDPHLTWRAPDEESTIDPEVTSA